METISETNFDASANQEAPKEPCKVVDIATGKPFEGRSEAPPEPEKAVIYWLPESEAHTVMMAEQALINAGGVYQRLGEIVALGVGQGKTSDEKTIQYPSLKVLTDYGMRLKLAEAAQFMGENKSGKIVAIHIPMDVVKMLQNQGSSQLPVIRGILNAPTLRKDGSVFQEPGFDERTGLLFVPGNNTWSPVPKNPTKEEAQAALDKLLFVLRDFPFAGHAGEPSPERSVALALILTAIVRQAFLFAPGFAFDAPAPRTGKGKIVNIAHVLAFGHVAAVENWATKEEENEKLLGAVLMEGTGALAIDNVEDKRALGGGLISKLLTEQKVSVRILGLSKRVIADTMMLISFTGNNIRFKQDITSRIIKCRLDARMESPEQRVFDWEPVAYAIEHREELVTAALTILRAFIVSGERVECTPFGVYTEWSQMIREPLLWLGESDPVQTNKDCKSDDPEREEALVVFEAIYKRYYGLPVSVRDLIAEATYQNPPGDPGAGGYRNLGLHNALLCVAKNLKLGDGIDSTRLGIWLGQNRDKVIGEYSLCSIGKRPHLQWVVESSAPKQPEGSFYEEPDMND
jgi:hypothetical protein